MEAISAAIRNGELTPGADLPSVRHVSETSGLSPGTAALAFRMLRERGVIASTHGRRSRVAQLPALPRPVGGPGVPSGVRDLSTASPDPLLLPDIGALLSPDLYEPALYDSESVHPALARVMRTQFAADGIVGPLTATNGALDAMERILAATVRPGETVVVEDPQWVSSLSLLRVLQLEVAPVPVDDEGLDPDALAAVLASRHCSALVLTPRAQNPRGSVMSEARAAALRAVVAQHPDLMVIEDDHAAPITDTPAATVTTDRRRWAVIRSMSKALGPDLRLAVTASDRDTADRVQGRMLLGPGWVSHFTQRIVAAALSDERSLEAVRHATEVYRQRRSALVSALAAYGIAAHGASGLNVLVPVHEEAAVTAHLMTKGWAVRPGEGFRLGTPPFIRVTTARLDPVDAVHLAADISEAVDGGTRRRDE